jgi:hypothetical protein
VVPSQLKREKQKYISLFHFRNNMCKGKDNINRKESKHNNKKMKFKDLVQFNQRV